MSNLYQADMVEKWNDSKWQSEFNYLKEVNMHYVIISTSITKDDLIKTIYPTKIPGGQMEYPEVDIVDMCLRNAEKTGMKIFLGINYNSDWWEKGPRDPDWLYAQMERGNVIAYELYTKYYSKYPNAFHGWYWVYEVDNLNFKTEDDFSVLAKAININLKHLKEKNHRLPLMLSPFMNSIYGTAEEYAKNWTYLFQYTDLGKRDIFCPQDSVGGGELKIDKAETFIKLNKRLKEYSAFKTKYHIMDSGYDYEYIYEQVRKEGAVPIIDYNFRNEKLTKEALENRGYDELGRPYAPCGKACSPNGYDSKKKSKKYICGKRKRECENCEHY